MVERLKVAIEKARAMRQQRARDDDSARGFATELISGGNSTDPESIWETLESIELSPAHLEANRIIAATRDNPAHVAFDVLRTRILGAFAKHGWTRLGITSPTQSCGKTFVSTNLAFSLARHPDCRTILMDMDLRSPGIAKALGIADPEDMKWFLTGDITADSFLCCYGENLALGLNSSRVDDAAELVLATSTADSLGAMQVRFAPDIVIYDLPPMLACDDVIGFLPQLDCVLLVAGGGKTRTGEIQECERLLKDQTHLLGVLLNEAEGVSAEDYGFYGQ